MTAAARDTPMMRQYRQAKAQHPEALLLFRMGDFYELFGEDARIAAEVLGITLTTRDKGKADPLPMAGVPYHALKSYLPRLVAAGHKVALCEQVDEPAGGRGLMKREVVEVVTPGTIVDDDLLDEQRHNYLAALALGSGSEGAAWSGAGLAFFEASTGVMILWQAPEIDARREGAERSAAHRRRILELLDRFRPAEVLVRDDLLDGDLSHLLDGPNRTLSPYPVYGFDDRDGAERLRRVLGVLSLDGYGLDDDAPGPMIGAAGALLAYMEETRKSALGSLASLRVLPPDTPIVVDSISRLNLELTETLRGERGRGTLLWVLDRTVTPMGARLLRDRLVAPIVDVEAIEARLDLVEAFFQDDLRRREIRHLLAGLGDVERLTNRLCLLRSSPRDILTLGRALSRLPELRSALEGLGGAVAALAAAIDPHEDFSGRILASLREDAPSHTREGGIFRPGIDSELDDLTELAGDGRSWLLRYEEEQRQRTGISSLKVRFNKVFGYFIEVTKANLDKVPEEEYIRKQTLTNAERFITAELKEYESRLLSAEERRIALEQELFETLRRELAAAAGPVRQTAQRLAELDVAQGLAQVARERGYVRPQVDESGVLDIRGGRHPVVEALAGHEPFVPNDIYLDREEQQIILLTGPNMAGKSTLLRQVALIALLAQMGSYVPAERARVGVADRIFTRVGASDNLARGQSTFLVEMHETANICHNATGRSLVILDEIGRGTSTFDGLSIAWAVAEYLHEAPDLGCRTLFATHYHELTELEGLLPRLKNFHVAVQQQGEEIVFLRRLRRGGVDQSFGIHVARLAGVPGDIIRRAREVLCNLEAAELDATGRPRRGRGQPARGRKLKGGYHQLTLFVPKNHPVVDELAAVDPNELTPLEALNQLDRLRRMLDDEEGGAR